MTGPTDDGRVMECLVNRSWVRVTAYIFRSWTGPRRIDGKAYTGPVYVLGTDDVARPAA